MTIRTRFQDRFYINDGGPVPGKLKIDDNAATVWSGGPRPDPNWRYTDRQGHWHARAVDEKKPYPTLERHVEHAECDGSCGGICQGEGYHVTRYTCRICGENITPGSFAGPYQFSVPGLKEWSAEVHATLSFDERVTLRMELGGNVYFGVAQVVSITRDSSMGDRAELIGIGPLGGLRGIAGRNEVVMASE